MQIGTRICTRDHSATHHSSQQLHFLVIGIKPYVYILLFICRPTHSLESNSLFSNSHRQPATLGAPFVRKVSRESQGQGIDSSKSSMFHSLLGIMHSFHFFIHPFLSERRNTPRYMRLVTYALLRSPPVYSRFRFHPSLWTDRSMHPVKERIQCLMHPHLSHCSTNIPSAHFQINKPDP